MKLIYTDKYYKEINYLKNASYDFDVGKYEVSTNDLDITIPTNKWDSSFDEGSLVYSIGTECGGIIENKTVNTADQEIILHGRTFRGTLEKEYIQPPSGQAYLVMKKEANTAIQELISGRFSDLFVVDNVGLSDIHVNYEIRDLNLLDALEKMLYRADIPSRLDISFYDGKVHLQAIPIVDLSELLQYDNSYSVNMIVKTSSSPYNHILALGTGELTNRIRINLYLKSDSTWSTQESESYYKGSFRKTYKYEDTNQEDSSELISNAIKKVEEKNKTESLSIDLQFDDADLFNIVGSKEEITGISFKKQITRKIYKGTIVDRFDNSNVSYKVGE